MRTLTLLCSFMGLLSALPQPLFYSPQTYGLRPFVYFGRSQRLNQGYVPASATTYGHSQSLTRGYVPATAATYVNSRSFGIHSTVTASTTVGDLLTDATSAVRSVQATLRQLVASPNIAAAANNILATSDNKCGISSVDAGVQSIQRAIGTLDRIVGASGLNSRLNQIKVTALIDTVQSFVPLRDPVEILRKASELVTLLQPLYNVGDGVGDLALDVDNLRCVAVLLDTVGSSNQVNFGTFGSGELNKAARIISTVSSFLDRLKGTFARLEDNCNIANGQRNADVLLSIGDLIDDVADIFVAAGDIKTGEKVRLGKKILRKITGELNKIRELDLVGAELFECNEPGDFSKAASVLEDLATLIEEVGVDNLQAQLGIDINFLFTAL